MSENTDNGSHIKNMEVIDDGGVGNNNQELHAALEAMESGIAPDVESGIIDGGGKEKVLMSPDDDDLVGDDETDGFVIEDPKPDEEPEKKEAKTEEVEEESDDKTEELPEDIQDERLSGSWSKLMKMHAKVKDRERQIKEKEAIIQEQSGHAQQVVDMLNLARSNPIKFLENSGVSYEQAFQHWTNQINGVESKTETTGPSVSEKDIDAIVAKRVQEQVQKMQAEADASRWVDESERVLQGDKYKALRVLNAGSEMRKLAALYYQKRGERITPEQAAEMLLPEAEQRLKQLRQGAAEIFPEEQTETKPKRAKRGRTLGSSHNETAPPPVAAGGDVGSDQEELERAMQLIR